jgi:hypothetical protein
LIIEDQVEHGQDIKYYITKELTCQDGPEKSELRAEILNKSAGIFLWVVLVVQILNTLNDRGASLPDMKTRLATIPADLKKLFQEILMKSEIGIETSVLFLQWMLFSIRPLQPTELFVAMEYSRSPDDSLHNLPMEIVVPDPERLTRFILNCSRGLVEVVQAGEARPFRPFRAATVQFIHETVREFLLKENGLASVCQALATNVAGISHEILRIACFRRVSMADMPKEYEHYYEASHKTNASLDQFKSGMHLKLPFLDYAISHLFDHAEQAQKHDISQQAFLKSQIDANGLWSSPQRLLWNALERYTTEKVEPDVTLIYFLAEQKYVHLLAVLLELSSAVNTPCGKYGSALQLSSYYGSQEIVKMLLEKGADVNAQGGYYVNALMAALERGHEKVVQMLLDAGVDVNVHAGKHVAALYVASISGKHVAALYVASISGLEEAVQLLLENGADVHGPGCVFGNALQAASFHGHEKVVQMLLDKGADVYASGGFFGNALEAASWQGHETVVQMLLDKDIVVHAEGGDYSKT